MRKAYSAFSRILSSRLSYRRAGVAIVSLVVVVSCLVVPFKVTVDGIFYISSAKSLFSSDFSHLYVWYREPGYPFFLWFVHLFGDAALFITIAQSAFLGLAGFIAFYCARKAVGQSDVSVSQLGIILLLLLNPMYLIYSGLVLQQALFSLQLALFALALLWSRTRPGWLSGPALVAGVLLHYVLAIWTSIGWIYLGLLPVAAVIYFSLSKVLSRRVARSARVLHRLFLRVAAGTAAILLVAAVYFVGLQAYAGWTNFKEPFVQGSSSATSVIEPLSSVPYIPTPMEMTTRILALMHIGTVGNYEKENTLFLSQQMIRNWPYAQWDTAFVSEPYSSFALDYLSLSNPSPGLHYVYSVAAKFASPAYSVAFLGLILALVVAVFRRWWQVLMVLVVPLYFLGVYAASNSPIDRYGIPAYPFAAAAVGLLATWGLRGVRSVVNRRRLIRA